MEIQKNTRNQILEAAIRLLIDKNIEDVTTRSIANEAGVSKGTLFHYFNTKVSLLYYATEKIYLDFLEKLLQITSQTPNEEVIRIATYEILNLYIETTGAIRILLNVLNTIDTKIEVHPSETITRESILENLLYPIYNESANVFQKLGFENPMIKARLYIGIVDGIGFQIEAEKITKGDPLIEEFAEEIINLFTGQ